MNLVNQKLIKAKKKVQEVNKGKISCRKNIKKKGSIINLFVENKQKKKTRNMAKVILGRDWTNSK